MKKILKISLGVNSGESIETMLNAVRTAEEYNFSSVWISDANKSKCPFSIAEIIAKNTTKIKIGVGLISPYIHKNREINQKIKNLSKRFGERFELCIGPGDLNRLRENNVKIPKGEELSNDLIKTMKWLKKEFKNDGVKCEIWIGAQGPILLASAHNYDGVLINQSDIEMIKWSLENINETNKIKGKIGVISSSMIKERANKENKKIIKEAALRIALGTINKVLIKTEVYDEMVFLKQENKDRDFKEVMKLSSDEVTKQFSISTNIEGIKDHLAKLKRIGVTHFTFGYPQLLHNESIKLIGDNA